MKPIIFALLTLIFNIVSNCPSLVTAAIFGTPTKLQASETNSPVTYIQFSGF